jgi:hypothetical protein
LPVSGTPARVPKGQVALAANAAPAVTPDQHESSKETTAMSETPDPARRARERIELEERAAAREAGAIGGVAGDEDLDPAQRPVREGGGGEAEGFEESEALLIEHASHGDQQSAHSVLHDQGRAEEHAGAESGEADAEYSSELDEEERAEGV